jgi:hypothetical protein
MANSRTLATARKNKKDQLAAEDRAQSVARLQAAAVLLPCSPLSSDHDTEPLDFPASDTVMAPVSDTDDIVVSSSRAGRKRKSGAALLSDMSDDDVDVPVKPARKKPGPKPKVRAISDVDESEDDTPKPAKKKPGRKPKAKGKPNEKPPPKKKAKGAQFHAPFDLRLK